MRGLANHILPISPEIISVRYLEENIYRNNPYTVNDMKEYI
jgi:hypothetical protein